MKMENATEHCANCGATVYQFSKKISASDGSSYCIRCAEELDRQYLSMNVCSVCTRLLDKREVKFVMPSRLYSFYFFARLPMESRLMCVDCYRKANKLDLIRKPLMKINIIRSKLRKSFSKEIVKKIEA